MSEMQINNSFKNNVKRQAKVAKQMRGSEISMSPREESVQKQEVVLQAESKWTAKSMEVSALLTDSKSLDKESCSEKEKPVIIKPRASIEMISFNDESNIIR